MKVDFYVDDDDYLFEGSEGESEDMECADYEDDIDLCCSVYGVD